MYRISNNDRDAIVSLLQFTREIKPATLSEQNKLRMARLALKRLARKRQEKP